MLPACVQADTMRYLHFAWLANSCLAVNLQSLYRKKWPLKQLQQLQHLILTFFWEDMPPDLLSYCLLLCNNLVSQLLVLSQFCNILSFFCACCNAIQLDMCLELFACNIHVFCNSFFLSRLKVFLFACIHIDAGLPGRSASGWRDYLLKIKVYYYYYYSVGSLPTKSLGTRVAYACMHWLLTPPFQYLPSILTVLVDFHSDIMNVILKCVSSTSPGYVICTV